MTTRILKLLLVTSIIAMAGCSTPPPAPIRPQSPFGDEPKYPQIPYRTSIT